MAKLKIIPYRGFPMCTYCLKCDSNNVVGYINPQTRMITNECQDCHYKWKEDMNATPKQLRQRRFILSTTNLDDIENLKKPIPEGYENNPKALEMAKKFGINTQVFKPL